ncbi:hypothetical protein SALBM217S_10304 [Streptomyces griseoloalbus]
MTSAGGEEAYDTTSGRSALASLPPAEPENSSLYACSQPSTTLTPLALSFFQ